VTNACPEGMRTDLDQLFDGPTLRKDARRRLPEGEVIQALTIVGVSIAIVASIAFVFVAREKRESELWAMDPNWRLEEEATGRCAACQGAGTRLEVSALATLSTLARVTCFRCGGTGEPPPPDIVQQWPKYWSGPTQVIRQERLWLTFKKDAIRKRMHR